ncbi:unnamed protein product, partial [Mesorhabditis belari]|uniref:Peptidase M20 dimerisation domain-containing protein n=1 Tax=Mesorhabditis belari TaxID=2138241 RepID=A0AAF3ETQ9_9BILA
MVLGNEVYDKVFRSIDVNADKFVEVLEEAVAIVSISAEPEHRDDCVKMSHWAKAKLESIGATAELVDAGIQHLHDGTQLPLPPIVFAQLGKDPKKKTLLVYGHLDVQPAKKEDGWNTDPFVLTEIDGKLFGRGSTDDKGPVIGWIHAIRTLQENGIDLPINMKFVFECMEEAGSEGLDEALHNRKDFLQDVDFTCISDNYWLGKKKPCLTYGLRGISYFFVKVECAKQDLHSGCYGGSIHEALPDLLWVLSQLTNIDGTINIEGLNEMVAPVTDDEKEIYPKIDFCIKEYQNDLGAHGLTRKTKEEILMRRWRFPSLSLHGVEGAFDGPGSKTVIPAKVTGKFSIRTVPNMTPEKVDEVVVAHLNKLWATRGSPNRFEVIPQHAGRVWLSDPNHPNFQAGAKAMKRVFDVEPDLTREGGSIPVTLSFQELTGKNVMLLPIGACDDMAHSQNEKINRRNYIEGTKVLAAYLLELGEFQ